MHTAELAALIRQDRPETDVAPLGLHNALTDTSPVAAHGTPVRLYGRYAIVGPTPAPGGDRPRPCARRLTAEPPYARPANCAAPGTLHRCGPPFLSGRVCDP